MDTFYLIVVICLVVLAVADLVVGVSNDAVNFLNSAFGSQVAKRKTILYVAATGILIGAASSSGMMEIARKGIFNPEMFSFADIMTIFLAVMITDILLLDLFNTFGMPTSTTVSIMFELLGAAFVVAVIKIISNGDSMLLIGEYLNTNNAILIIAGIFLSVFIAFSLGLIAQFFTRLIFSFNLNKTVRKNGPIFGGIAIATIAYFLLIKGMKGSTFISIETKEWINNYTVILMGTIVLSSIFICLVLTHFFKVNVLKLVVLFGTFSLAMAFAGNDLVNFIGVPLAGLQSFQIFQASNLSASELNMGVLGAQIQTNSLILFGAGVIMILSLWFSKKAQTVTETEINLSRQNEGSERFKPNFIARWIVSGGIRFSTFSKKFISDEVANKIDARFKKSASINKNVKEKPAFDLVRASVNLMMASVLIAFATSLKLPLSTTYVSFMVAMGTSLADRAWDRDSAVYRVAGVVNVIGGWLVTAAVASTAAGLLALVIYFGGVFAVVSLMMLTVAWILRSQFVHRKKEREKSAVYKKLENRERISYDDVIAESRERISLTMFKISYVIKDLIVGLEVEDKVKISKAKNEVELYRKNYEELSASFYYYLQKIESKHGAEGRYYIHALSYLNNISGSVLVMGEKVDSHVSNFHLPMQTVKMNELKDLANRLSHLFIEISDLILERKGGLTEVLQEESEVLLTHIENLELVHLSRVKNNESSAKNSMLYLSILLECRDMIVDFSGLINLFQSIRENEPPMEPIDKVKMNKSKTSLK